MWAKREGPHEEDGAFPVFTQTGYYMQDAKVDDSRVKRTRKDLLDSLRCVVPSPKSGRWKSQRSPSSLSEALGEEVSAFRQWDGRRYNEEASLWEFSPIQYRQEDFVTAWPDLKAFADEGQHFALIKDETCDESFRSASPEMTSPSRKSKTASLSVAKYSTRKETEAKIVDFNPVAYMDSILHPEGAKKTTTEKPVSTLLSRIQELESALQEEGIPIVRFDLNGMPCGAAPDVASVGQVENALPQLSPSVDTTVNQPVPLSTQLLHGSNAEQDEPPIRWLTIDHGSLEKATGDKEGNVNQRFDALEVNQELFLSKSSPFRPKKRGAGGNGNTRVGNLVVNPSVGSGQTWFTPEPEFW